MGEKESELPDLLTQVRLVTLEWRALTFEAGGSARSCVLSAIDVFKKQVQTLRTSKTVPACRSRSIYTFVVVMNKRENLMTIIRNFKG